MSARLEIHADAGAAVSSGTSGLAPLLLARIAVAGGATRAEIGRDLLPLVSHRLSPAEWRAACAERIAALVAQGQARETRGRLTLTDAGTDVVTGLFGARSQAKDWAGMRDLGLVALALGVERESAARLRALATPEGLRAMVLQKAFGLPLKGNQTANRLRVELAVVALERAFGNRIKGGLGASGGFNAKAGRLLAGQLSARPRDFGTDGRLIAELAAEQVGAPQSDADAVRLAVLRRYVTQALGVVPDRHVEAPGSAARPVRPREPAHREAVDLPRLGDSPQLGPQQAANDRGPPVPRPVPGQRPDLAEFAREVKAAAAQVAEGWPGNRKAFISRIWQVIRASWPDWQISEIEFKCMLAEAHRAGGVVLANADLKDKKSMPEIEASAIAYKNTVWHYVRVEE